MVAKPERDPLALAKWVYRQYVDHPGEQRAASRTITMEPTSKSKGQSHQFARAGETWTDKERAALASGVLQGKSFGVLAMQHQRSPASVRAELAKVANTLARAARD